MNETVNGSPAKRRRPRQKRSREKVAKILAAARKILEEEGPNGFNTNRVAKEAGVGVGSLYEYFPDKGAIATQLMEELSDVEANRVLARFAELEDADFDVLLPALVDLTIGIYRQHLPLRMALWALAPGNRTLGRSTTEQQVLSVIESRLRDMSPHDNAELHATVAFHIVDSLVTQLVLDGRWDDKTTSAEVVRAVRAYLDRI